MRIGDVVFIVDIDNEPYPVVMGKIKEIFPPPPAFPSLIEVVDGNGKGYWPDYPGEIFSTKTDADAYAENMRKINRGIGDMEIDS